MRRWRERLAVDGYNGLADRRKGMVSPKRVPLETCETVLGLYQGMSYDLNMRHEGTGVQVIPAYSPQAPGRSERSFATWQGRLPQELRLAGTNTTEAANRFLRECYIDAFNNKFTVAAEQRVTAFRRSSRLGSGLDF